MFTLTHLFTLTLQQVAATVVIFVAFNLLCVLNTRRTQRHSPAPWQQPVGEHPSWRRVIVTKIAPAILGIALTVLILWGSYVTSWQVALMVGVCSAAIAHRKDKRGVKFALIGVFTAMVAFAVFVPSMLGVQLLWFAPMVALAGFLPRLMIGLRTLTGRDHMWLMSPIPWGLLMFAGLAADMLFMENGAFDLVRLSLEWGLTEPFMLWFNNPWLDLSELVLYAEPAAHIGVFTAYAVFGFLSAMALLARRTGNPDLVVIPLCLLSVTLAMCVVTAWLFGVFGFVNLGSMVLVGGQVLGIVLLLLDPERKKVVPPSIS